MIDITLDARGLICPLPVLKARKKLLGVKGAARLTVHVSDPATAKDFQLFCAESGYAFSQAPAPEGAIFTIEKDK